MRRLVRSEAGVQMGFESLLGDVVGNSAIQLFARRKFSLRGNELVNFDAISITPAQFTDLTRVMGKVQSYPLGPRINLTQREVFQIPFYDIRKSSEDDFGSVFVVSSPHEDVKVYHGDRGRAASEKESPLEMTKAHSIVIPRKKVGILSVRTHVPFLIDSGSAMAVAMSQMMIVPAYAQNVARGGMEVICPLPEDVAKRISIKLQDKIFNDPRHESFYEEVTSSIYLPTEYNQSSGTLMNFESERKSQATDMHYHPGERILHIFTTKKPAGVVLNFCGIEESPSERKDCERHIEFPSNSYIVLKFSSYTHHQFYGDFVCLSVHPQEGPRITEAVKSGNLPKGFLESATFFSKEAEESKSDESKVKKSGESALLDDKDRVVSPSSSTSFPKHSKPSKTSTRTH